MATDPDAASKQLQTRTEPLLRVALTAKHVALTLAVLATTTLLIDYRNAGDPAFCGLASDCFAVRTSAYSHLGGIPLPQLALPTLTLLLFGSLLARTVEHHRMVAIAAGLGSVAAGVLIYVQASLIGAFCKWCVIVDTSMIVTGLAAAAIAWRSQSADAVAAAAFERAARLRPVAVAAWGAAATLAIAMPFLWAKYPDVPPAPPEIAAHQEAGKVTIVAFTDFECPFCRKLHPALDEVRKQHGDKVRVIRKMKPLGGHVGALPAAKAYVCAPIDKREDVAHYLYEAESEVLTDKKILAASEKLGIADRDAFAKCLSSPATGQTIDRESTEFAALHGKGLPFTWVNARVILGADIDRLSRTVEEELSGPRPALPIAAMFVLLGIASAVAAALSWKPPSDQT